MQEGFPKRNHQPPHRIVVIGAPVPDEPCSYCGKMEELRPYGRDEAKICFDCSQLPENKDLTLKMFKDVLRGKTEQPKDNQKN